MFLFLFAPDSERVANIAHRLSMRGYQVEYANRRYFTGEPTAEQMRRRIMRCITECDAVVVPEGVLTAEHMARLLVVADFAGKEVGMVDDLPGHAPEDKRLTTPIRMGTTVAMVPADTITSEVVGRRMRHRVQHLVARAALFFDHGNWLKNPNARRAFEQR